MNLTKKKILIVTDFYKPHISGITQSIDLLIRSLDKKRFKITILSGNHTGTLNTREIINDVLIIRTKPSFNLSRGFYSFNLVKEFIKESKKNDFINIHYPLSEIFPLIFLTTKPIIFNYHCLPSYKSFILKFISLYFYFFGIISMLISRTVVIFSKDYFSNFLFHKYFLNKTNEIFPYSENKFILLDKDKTYKKDNIFKIGYIGRLSEEKGIKNLIYACDLLNNYGINYQTDIVGDLKDTRFKKHIDELIAISSNNKRIKFIGKINDNTKNIFFSSIDVLVLPSVNHFEAFGLVQIEAMMYGVMVVASDLKGVRMPVKLTGNGYLFKKDNFQELTECLMKIEKLKDKYDRKKIQKSCLTFFNSKQFKEKYLMIFK